MSLGKTGIFEMSFKELFSLKGNLLHDIHQEGRFAITDDSCSTRVLCELSENIRPLLSTLGALVAWKEVPGLA